MLQFIKTYTLPGKLKPTDSPINQTAIEYGKRSQQMHTCLTYNEVDQETDKHLETAMTMIEAYLYSGYEINQNELDALVANEISPKLKMTELSKKKFYLNDKLILIFIFSL
jgi:hypothetical protein